MAEPMIHVCKVWGMAHFLKSGTFHITVFSNSLGLVEWNTVEHAHLEVACPVREIFWHVIDMLTIFVILILHPTGCIKKFQKKKEK